MSYVLPNIRKIFIPDPGYIVLDADLAGAEAQVVAAEAGDLPLLEKFQRKADIHSENAAWKWKEGFTSLSKDSHLRYERRQACKHSVHAIHNGGQAYAIAKHPGINWTVQEAEAFRSHWLMLHPGILDYHKRTQHNLNTSRMARNRFGYRIIYYDRMDNLLPQALAWVPQSTIAEVTFRGALQLESACPWVEVLMQVHDSLIFQIPIHKSDCLHQVRKALLVEIPYDPVLIIPWGIKGSTKSWGDVEDLAA